MAIIHEAVDFVESIRTGYNFRQRKGKSAALYSLFASDFHSVFCSAEESSLPRNKNIHRLSVDFRSIVIGIARTEGRLLYRESH